MSNHQLINQDSGNTEWFTPPEIIEAARTVMCKIDLDPASCSEANKIVKADRFYTKEEDGLALPWFGNVWLNHPFSKANNPKWITKLLYEYSISVATGKRNMYQACCICFAATSEKWFRPLLYLPQCFLYRRTNYLNEAGEKVKGVTKGSVVTYIGPNVDRFADIFTTMGVVKVPFTHVSLDPLLAKGRPQT